MKKYLIVVFAVMLLALASAVYSIDFDNSQIPGLKIANDVDGALNTAKIENKTVMIVFDQDSCVYCDMFKKDVLSNPDVQKELNEKCIVIFVDINKHPEIANKYKVFGTPTIQFLDSNGKEITKVEGYSGADEFLNTLKEI
ncbi:thioredoxin family protein [uncultured Methanobrevibacter sp.]|uniref:thioredoxin family protein n=1 Tax=uncultured Methanobrevibacter sp. TaxID=253161 RepID=UPI0025F0FC33|nr:thioredoxin family protein [uncultured Methanobrevibacter sp.]